jgi:hypothetical protein
VTFSIEPIGVITRRPPCSPPLEKGGLVPGAAQFFTVPPSKGGIGHFHRTWRHNAAWKATIVLHGGCAQCLSADDSSLHRGPGSNAGR